MSVSRVSVLYHLSKCKKPITPTELRDKLGMHKRYGIGTTFSDLAKRGFVKKTKKPTEEGKGNAQPYTITAKGLKEVADNKEAIQPIEVIIVESAKKRSEGSAPIIPMNAKANTAIDSISKLLDDYNRANQMLKVIHAQIGEFLNDNQLLTGDGDVKP